MLNHGSSRECCPVWYLRPPLASSRAGCLASCCEPCGTDHQRIMTAALHHFIWLPVKYRIGYKLLVIVFRALYGRTHACIVYLIAPHVNSPLWSRATSRPTICQPCVASRSTQQSQIIWPPLLVSYRNECVKHAGWRFASDRYHKYIKL